MHNTNIEQTLSRTHPRPHDVDNHIAFLRHIRIILHISRHYINYYRLAAQSIPRYFFPLSYSTHNSQTHFLAHGLLHGQTSKSAGKESPIGLYCYYIFSDSQQLKPIDNHSVLWYELPVIESVLSDKPVATPREYFFDLLEKVFMMQSACPASPFRIYDLSWSFEFFAVHIAPRLYQTL